MTLNERLQEAFDKRVFGTAMTSASDLLSAMTAIEQAEAENAALKEQGAQLIKLNNNLISHRTEQYETITQQADVIERVKELEAMSVTNIMIAVTPGHDGMGQEIYAKSVDEVVAVLSDMSERLEALEDKAVILRATIKAQEHWQARVAQQADVIEQMREALRHYAYRAGQDWQIAREALALQPSPEILEVRDDRVADACGECGAIHATGANSLCDK